MQQAPPFSSSAAVPALSSHPHPPSGDDVTPGGTAAAHGHGQARQSSHGFLVVGTSGGVLQILDADRVGEHSRGAALLHRTFDVRVFTGAVSAIALSPAGDLCAASCVADGFVAFFRVINSTSEVALQLLGLYPVREPRLLAWAPPEAEGERGSVRGRVRPGVRRCGRACRAATHQWRDSA